MDIILDLSLLSLDTTFKGIVQKKLKGLKVGSNDRYSFVGGVLGIFLNLKEYFLGFCLKRFAVS
jgi:hypothetical protein